MGKPKPQVIEDQEHQRVFERVAAIDVAKASGMGASDSPGRDGRPRASKVWEGPAVTSAVTELGLRLLSDRVQMVTLEATSDYSGGSSTTCSKRSGWRCSWCPGEGLPAAQGPPEDR